MTAPETPHKPYSTKSPPGPWDYLIIGSGMGGMTAGALLTALGKRVLLLEQHYVPGGFTHTFKRQRWVWDVGVHAVGEVGDRALIGKVLKRLTGGQLEWASLGKIYEEFYFPEGVRVDFPDRREQFIENLCAIFPDERQAILEYIDLVRAVGGAMKGYYLSRALPPRLARLGDLLVARKAQGYLELNTKKVLDELTTNAKLKTILAAQWGYYGSPPSRSSFAMQALVAKHYWYGGFYPVGGSKKIADALLGQIAAGGGWTRISADVSTILVEHGRATGVRLEGGEELRASRVISAAGALATVTRLLPAEARDAEWARSIARLPPSPAHLCLNLGFKGDLRAAGASSANKWFYETWDTEHTAWDIATKSALAPVLYTSFPSLKDPAHAPGPEQLHTGEVVTFVPYSIFERWSGSRWMRRGEEYEKLKEELGRRMLEQLLGHMPALRPLVAYHELSTPLSTESFTRATHGAIYGIEPTPERFENPWLRPKTPLPGLYLAGSDMGMVGVVGAFVGGILAALAAEPIGTLRYLRGVR